MTADQHAGLSNADLPEVVASEYRVLPTGYADSPLVDKFHFEIRVVWRGQQTDGSDGWAVLWGGRCLNSDGAWEWEPNPSSRDDDFLGRCRFSREEAIHRAVAVVDTMTMNGRTFAEWNRRLAGQSVETPR